MRMIVHVGEPFWRAVGARELALESPDESISRRATRGHRIERGAFERMLDEYCAARGWDAQGRLPAERVAELEGHLW